MFSCLWDPFGEWLAPLGQGPAAVGRLLDLKESADSAEYAMRIEESVGSIQTRPAPPTGGGGYILRRPPASVLPRPRSILLHV